MGKLAFLGLHIPRCILKSVNIALGYVLEHLLDPCKKRRKSYLYQICTSQFMNQMVKLHKIYLVVSQDDWSNKLKYNTCRGGNSSKNTSICTIREQYRKHFSYTLIRWCAFNRFLYWQVTKPILKFTFSENFLEHNNILLASKKCVCQYEQDDYKSI